MKTCQKPYLTPVTLKKSLRQLIIIIIVSQAYLLESLSFYSSVSRDANFDKEEN